MNYKMNQLKNDDELCNYHKTIEIKVDSYKELITILKMHKYDHSNNLLAKEKDSILEEVIISKDHVEMASDSKIRKYKDLTFVIVIYCKNTVTIDQYCSEHSEHTTGPYVLSENTIEYLRKQIKDHIKDKSIDHIKDKSIDQMHALPVSKKIQYILAREKRKLTFNEIYDIGMPWNITTSTPKNTVSARCSTLLKKGLIKKEGNHFYLDLETSVDPDPEGAVDPKGSLDPNCDPVVS
jgi:hypothetical protein